MAGACPALRSRSAKNSRSTSIARTQVCPLHLVRPSHSATLQPPLWRSVVGNARHRRPKWRSPRLTTTFETEAEAKHLGRAKLASRLNLNRCPEPVRRSWPKVPASLARFFRSIGIGGALFVLPSRQMIRSLHAVRRPHHRPDKATSYHHFHSDISCAVAGS